MPGAAQSVEPATWPSSVPPADALSVGDSDYGSLGWYTLTSSTTGTPTTPSPPPTTPPATPPIQTPPPTTLPPTPTTTPPPTPTVAPEPPAVLPLQSAQPGATAAALGIVTSALPTAARRQRYRTVLVAAGGNGSYLWTRTKGALPRGLTLSRSGAITGRATSKVTRRIRVRVTDSTGTASQRWLTIRVR